MPIDRWLALCAWQQQLQPPAAYSFSIDRRSIDSIVVIGSLPAGACPAVS
jgi:hypothetical protein